MGRRPSCPKQERNGQPEQPHRNGRWEPWRRASLGESGQKFHPHHPGPEDQATASAPVSSEAGLVRGGGGGQQDSSESFSCWRTALHSSGSPNAELPPDSARVCP